MSPRQFSQSGVPANSVFSDIVAASFPAYNDLEPARIASVIGLDPEKTDGIVHHALIGRSIGGIDASDVAVTETCVEQRFTASVRETR
jgi:hypothetical protein